MTEIIVALVATIPATLTFLYKWLELRKKSKADSLKIKEQKLINEALENDLKVAQKEKFQDAIKYSFFEQLSDLIAFTNITNGVKRLFNQTKADRFLILGAINGSSKFNTVSVYYEQHKDKIHSDESAMTMYQNIGIDDVYRNYLIRAEHEDMVILETKKMEDGMLKRIYEDEGVTHSIIFIITRRPIDGDDDFLVFSSIATHINRPFTEREKTRMKLVYDAIIVPNVVQVIENKV